MSGWWFISSAGGVIRFTKSTDPWKSSNLNSRLIESPSRSQPGMPSSRCLMSSSPRSAMVVPVRIASLVPSATEMLFALGLGDSVVAVTHECDHPPAALRLPQVTRSVIPAGLGTAEIDRAVRERTERGEALYELDAERLALAGAVVVVMPCGYDARTAGAEAREHAGELAGLGAGAVHPVDAAAYFSRPGPRLVDGVELLARLLHPARLRRLTA